MNLILLESSEVDACSSGSFSISLSGRRCQHIANVVKPRPGDRLQIGIIDGLMGSGLVVAVSDRAITLHCEVNQAPPPTLPLTVLMALPRPKMLKRVLQTIATLGVEQLILLNSFRVEKSYWQTPFLSPDAIREQLLLGLEQARATQLPDVILRKRFKPFVEDELPEWVQGRRCWVAHPYGTRDTELPIHVPSALAIGPEGGFIPYEVEKLQSAGFQALSLGPRILRVETALPVLVTRLFP